MEMYSPSTVCVSVLTSNFRSKSKVTYLSLKASLPDGSISGIKKNGAPAADLHRNDPVEKFSGSAEDDSAGESDGNNFS